MRLLKYLRIAGILTVVLFLAGAIPLKSEKEEFDKLRNSKELMSGAVVDWQDSDNRAVGVRVRLKRLNINIDLINPLYK